MLLAAEAGQDDGSAKNFQGFVPVITAGSRVALKYVPLRPQGEARFVPLKHQILRDASSGRHAMTKG